MRIFISYSRSDKGKVDELVKDVQTLGHEVWFDQEISGGAVWWDHVLSQIRSCDIFVAAISNEFVSSQACSSEVYYATMLGKSILPVLAKDIPIKKIPSELKLIQHINYVERDASSAIMLAKALSNISQSPPLQNPLPTPPDIPTTYEADLLGQLRRTVEGTVPLTKEVQHNSSSQLIKLLDDFDLHGDAVMLLNKLRSRGDTYAVISDAIDNALKNTSPPRDNAKTSSSGIRLGRFLGIDWYL